MKSEVISTVSQKPKVYPYLGVASDGLVVLFSESGTGMVVVVGSSDYNIGSHMKAWSDPHFKPLIGKVILSNED